MEIQFDSHTKMVTVLAFKYVLKLTNSLILQLNELPPLHENVITWIIQAASAHHKYLIGPTKLHIKFGAHIWL
jgi:hypothetical protein